jgi:hypothetical protein
MKWIVHRTERPFKWLLWSTILTLPAPFVWLQIGELGYVHYGPDVPDVYILGGFITGKDLSFFGILYAWIAQFTGIALSILCVTLAKRFRHYRAPALLFLLLNALLLSAFPFWLPAYVEGVIHNSDMTFMTAHPHIGLLLYVACCVLTLRLLVIYSLRND